MVSGIMVECSFIVIQVVVPERRLGDLRHDARLSSEEMASPALCRLATLLWLLPGFSPALVVCGCFPGKLEASDSRACVLAI